MTPLTQMDIQFKHLRCSQWQWLCDQRLHPLQQVVINVVEKNYILFATYEKNLAIRHIWAEFGHEKSHEVDWSVVAFIHEFKWTLQYRKDIDNQLLECLHRMNICTPFMGAYIHSPHKFSYSSCKPLITRTTSTHCSWGTNICISKICNHWFI